MNEHSRHIQESIRLMAFVPAHQGTGFVVLENSNFLLERGVRTPGADRQQHLAALTELLARHRPDVVLLENIESPDYRRGEASRALVEDLQRAAADYGIAVKPISKLQVRAHFGLPKGATKIDIARAVCKVFPELASRVPSDRKPWVSEGHSLPMFEALGLTLASLGTD